MVVADAAKRKWPKTQQIPHFNFVDHGQFERTIMAQTDFIAKQALEKFKHPDTTADGEVRASVHLKKLETLWFNTGTLCNLECTHCYIESSPRNDRLAYITTDEVRTYLDEIKHDHWGTQEIGFTGGEPFMNPEIISMLELSLTRGFQTLVLTNGMRPMQKQSEHLLNLRAQFNNQLHLRISLDHYTPPHHEQERGIRSWQPTLQGLKWLSDHKFKISVAGRSLWNEDETHIRAGFAKLFNDQNIAIDAHDPIQLVIFPEMDETAEVPEITTQCWGILDLSPDAMMCASSRMVVKRKNTSHPIVLSCTLLPYDPQFELGKTLSDSKKEIKLNHPHCAKFCVLGGGSCSKSHT
jgi:uncharacterized Fe-S cluster-containing radical SAM superfamily protein